MPERFAVRRLDFARLAFGLFSGSFICGWVTTAELVGDRYGRALKTGLIKLKDRPFHNIAQPFNFLRC